MRIPPDAPIAGQAPAGFWQRYAAWSLDATLLALPTWLIARGYIAQGSIRFDDAVDALAAPAARAAMSILQGASPVDAARQLLADPALAAATQLLHAAFVQALALPALVFAGLALAWHVGFEQSPWRGTPGKRALRLVVTDTDGAWPTVLRSLARFVAGGASWFTLNLGHAMAALPPRHLALHDRLSATRVVAGRATLPPWVCAWILLQLLALVAANIWLLLTLQAAMQTALERM